MKIYIASSWTNSHQQEIAEFLRSNGHEVYEFHNPSDGRKGLSWEEIDPLWKDWSTEQYVAALKHDLAINCFNYDFDGMKWADCCVMIPPCDSSANSEAGWMKGAGKGVIVYFAEKQEPELMYKLYDAVVSDKETLLRALDREHFFYELEKNTEELVKKLRLMKQGRISKKKASEIEKMARGYCTMYWVPTKVRTVSFTIVPINHRTKKYSDESFTFMYEK